MTKINTALGFQRARALVEAVGQQWKYITIIKNNQQLKDAICKWGLPNHVSEREDEVSFGTGGSIFVDNSTGKYVAYASSHCLKKGQL